MQKIYFLYVAFELPCRNKLTCSNSSSSVSNAPLGRFVMLSTFSGDSIKFHKVIREVAADENKNPYQIYSESKVSKLH